MLPTSRSSVVRSMVNSSSRPSSDTATLVSSTSALMSTSLWIFCTGLISRSEERRVGEECRSRGAPHPLKKKKEKTETVHKDPRIEPYGASDRFLGRPRAAARLVRVVCCAGARVFSSVAFFFFFQAEDGIRDA